MYIERFKNNGTDYLRLSENYKTPGSNRTKKKVVLNIGPLSRFSDGKPDYLERLRQSFRDGKPLIPILEDYLENKEKKEQECVFLPFPLNVENADGAFTPKLLSDIILNPYMEQLGLSHLFAMVKSRSKIQYDLLGFVKLVVYGRILHPSSKKAAIEQNNSYFSPILKEGFNPDNVYDMLDIINQRQASIFQLINKALQGREKGRDTSVIFYDVTNFYFEIECNDPDIVNEDGVVIEEGLRKRGHGKENRPQPIVQMGMFMDRDGIPIGCKAFPGNRHDKTTMVDAVSAVIEPMGYERYVYCADRGLCTMQNLAYHVRNGMGYLLSKSIKKSKKEEREWIIQSEDYVEIKDGAGNVTFKYKSRIMRRDVEMEDGTSVSFEEKVIAFWSLEYYKREQHMMESFAGFLKDLEDETKSFTLSSAQIKGIKRFLKDEVVDALEPDNDEPTKEDTSGSAQDQQRKPDADTVNPFGPHQNGLSDDVDQNQQEAKSENAAGEHIKEPEDEETRKSEKPKRKRLTQEEKEQKEAEKKAEAARKKSIKESRTKKLNEQLKEAEKARKMIDWEKVNQWRDYAGYYQIVTSELETDDLTAIGTYRLLTQIENRFRVMKGTLDTRPVYVRTAEHINAHLVLCVVALIIMSLIQKRIKDNEKDSDKESEKKWETGMNPDRIQDALNAFQIENMPQGYLRLRSIADDQPGKDLRRLLDAHGVKIMQKLYTPGELRKLRGTVKIL